MSLSNTHWGAERIGAMLRSCRTIHFIGVGGVSMCSLAEITLHDGMHVSGSDRTDSERLDRLRRLGADICIGHNAACVQGADAVVYTVAIGEENPEYQAALHAGKPLISRADYLGYLMMRYRTRIGVAGMNGKSTTTAMCAQILQNAGDPTVFCGAELTALGGTPCRIGQGREQMVFEACEYMDSFLDFNPTMAVLLNIGMDHVDYFHSMEQIRGSFLRFAQRTGEDGCIVANADDPELMRAMEPYRGRTYTFGLSQPADFQAADLTAVHGCRRFTFCHRGEPVCRIALRQPGELQVVNALAAASPAGSRGLFFLPYLCGERCPHNDAYARGVFFGLSASHGSGDMIRAVMEGITYGLLDCFDMIRDSGCTVDRVYVSGGASNSALWMGMIADMFGVPTVQNSAPEAGALGAVLLAGAACGAFPDVMQAAERITGTGREFLPRPENTARYAEGHAIYGRLYERLKDTFADAAALQGG